MKKIIVCVENADAYTDFCGTLTAGMRGVPVAFSFDSAWDNLNKIAVFRCADVVKDRALLATEETTVPWEVLVAEGYLEIGVEGRRADGAVVIPTVWAKIGPVVAGANASQDPGSEPTPTVYDEIMAMAGAAVLYTQQNLTPEQMQLARANIGATTVAEVLAALPVYNGEVVE